MSEENTSTYENIEEENSIGHVQIAGEVIAIIAGLAATEVDGVSRLAGSLSNELASRLGKKNPAKGVKVELLPGEVKVDLAIDVLYEYSIPTVTTQVQDKVKQAIETPYAKSVEQVMGYEGTAAKIYFKVLGKLIDEQFVFEGRSRRPPMDPFNSLISLGYSIILNELYGKIEGKELNPYFGVMHKDREKHPTLASDLMEEWRAVLIDTTALSMLNGHELVKEDFYTGIDQPGVFLEKDGFRKYIQKLEGKFRTENRYLSYIDYSVSFRRAMDLQVNQFVKAIETENVNEYMPVIIR